MFYVTRCQRLPQAWGCPGPGPRSSGDSEPALACRPFARQGPEAAPVPGSGERERAEVGSRPQGTHRGLRSRRGPRSRPGWSRDGLRAAAGSRRPVSVTAGPGSQLTLSERRTCVPTHCPPVQSTSRTGVGKLFPYVFGFFLFLPCGLDLNNSARPLGCESRHRQRVKGRRDCVPTDLHLHERVGGRTWPSGCRLRVPGSALGSHGVGQGSWTEAMVLPRGSSPGPES